MSFRPIKHPQGFFLFRGSFHTPEDLQAPSSKKISPFLFESHIDYIFLQNV